VEPSGHAGYGLQYGIKPCLYTCDITFKTDTEAKSLRLLRNWRYPQGYSALLAVQSADALQTVDLATLTEPAEFVLEPGDWFGVYSDQATNSHLFVNRSDKVRLRVVKPPHPAWLSVWAALDEAEVKAGETYHFELFSLGYPVDVEVAEAEDFIRAVEYLRQPDGFEVLLGKRLEAHGVIELEPHDYAAEIRLPRPERETDLTLPVRLRGLNRRWTAGLFMKRGYVQAHYGPGGNRYRPLGIDLDGNAYVPVYPDLAEQTHLMMGHPVVADERGRELFIQVTQTSGGTGGEFHWWIAVNNPTDRAITTTLSNRMSLPGIKFESKEISVASGEHLVVEE